MPGIDGHFQRNTHFDNRGDSLFELMDAIVETPLANSFAELSLASACTRRWPSIYKALQQATVDLPRLRLLCLQQVPPQSVLHFALDVVAMRRMQSPTLRERRFCHGARREVSGKGVIIGLPYSLLAYVERRGASWAPALHTQRIQPHEQAVTVAVEQTRWLAENLDDQLTACVGLDGSYGNKEFFLQMRTVPIVAVARLRNDRVMYRHPLAPDQQNRGPGRPPKYGSEFRFADPKTWHKADEELEFDDERFGKVRLEMWRDLRFRVKDAIVDIDVVRSQIHLDKHKPPKARWYGVHKGSKAEIRLEIVFDCIVHRWPIEPANRFRKQRLHAELPKVREARSSDVWMTLLQMIEWEMMLWREVATDERLPWQKAISIEKLTPGRVIRSLKENLMLVGSPVRKVLPRGKSPGWQKQRVRKRPPKYRLESKKRKRLLEMANKE